MQQISRALRTRAVVLITLTATVSSLVTASTASADDLRHRKGRVDKRIEVARHDLDASSSRLRVAAAAAVQARARVVEARSDLARKRAAVLVAAAMDREAAAALVAADERLSIATTQLESTRSRIREAELSLRRFAVETYQSGGPSLMALTTVLDAGDPSTLVSRMSSVEVVEDTQSSVIARMQASEALAVVRQAELDGARDARDAQRAVAAENLRSRQQAESAAQEAAASVRVLLAQRKAAEAAATRARRADLIQLRKLQKERTRIEQLLQRRAAQAVAVSGNQGGGDLLWPVHGRISTPFGWRIHPIYGYKSYHDGIDIAAGCGTPVLAPAAGKVLETYFQTAYGNRIVVDNGAIRGVGVATIYNHLERFAVSPGDRVERGQVLGYVGSTGWSTGCHLHFSVYANGSAVDPMGWL